MSTSTVEQTKCDIPGCRTFEIGQALCIKVVMIDGRPFDMCFECYGKARPIFSFLRKIFGSAIRLDGD